MMNTIGFILKENYETIIYFNKNCKGFCSKIKYKILVENIQIEIVP